MSELTREEFIEVVDKMYMCLSYDAAMPLAQDILAHDAALRARVEALTQERDRLRAALEQAKDAIHSEYCGAEHHLACTRVQQAISQKEPV